MKAIHNASLLSELALFVVLYPKDTEKWKQFTTSSSKVCLSLLLFCIPKILKNESNSQPFTKWRIFGNVVLYPKDTEKWKQFTTKFSPEMCVSPLFCIPKILKNESNSQPNIHYECEEWGCFVSQRYWKMKAIHNQYKADTRRHRVVLYPKDTEKWKQFTTKNRSSLNKSGLFCIPKILKNESNSQLLNCRCGIKMRCFVSQRYWKMKAIHNSISYLERTYRVVLYPKDTEKWKQFTTLLMIMQLPKWLFCIPKILKNEI